MANPNLSETSSGNANELRGYRINVKLFLIAKNGSVWMATTILNWASDPWTSTDL